VGRGTGAATGAGYRIADRRAVRHSRPDREESTEGDVTSDQRTEANAAGNRDSGDDETDHSGGTGRTRWPPSLPTGVGGRSRGPAVAVFVVVLFVAPRALPYRQVFREGNVVLLANDPYFYAYWVEGLLARSSSPFALGTLADISAPLSFEGGEPLFAATMWLVSALLGGSDVAPVVLASYPVVAALCTGGLVYVIGAHVLDDHRIGVASAILLAILPASALRTVVGFGDHHAFNYVWVLATAAALAWLVAREDSSKETVRLGAVALGVSVAGLTLAWEGAPLVLVPVVATVAVSVPLDVAEGRSPWQRTRPVAAGLGLGAVLSLGAHLLLGWQSFLVVVVPTLLAGGTVVFAATGELVERRGVSTTQFVVVELAVPVVGFVLVGVFLDGAVTELVDGVRFLLGSSSIGETASAFSVAERLGVKLFGVAHFVALPVMAWGVLRTVVDDRRWLVPCVFGWYFFALAVVQLRFVGQFVPFVALFAATGALWWAARYDLTATPVPIRGSPGARADGDSDGPTASDGDSDGPTASDGDRSGSDGRDEDTTWFDTEAVTWRSGLAVAVVVVALVATSGVFFPGVTASSVPDRNYQTAAWMAEDADERGLTYPDNYVFSRWGNNRMFNYFVSGRAENYSYAQSSYTKFVSSDRPGVWYERLRNRTGYVVLEPLPRRSNPMQEHLYVAYGSRWGGYEAVSHYRVVYASENRDSKVFVLVPGARVTGRATPNATVEVRANVDVPHASFFYRKQVTTRPNGTYEAVVPYPGEYEVRTAVGNENRNGTGATATVTVPDPAVRNGTSVRVDKSFTVRPSRGRHESRRDRRR